MVCRIIQLPVGLEVKPVPTFVPKGESPSRPQQASIAASIGNVVGRVIHPVVALLNSPSGWFDHTTPGAHSHIAHHHRPHNFTVLNHTDHHGQSHNTRPHRNRFNFTAPPNVGDVRNQLAGHGDVNRHQVCPFSVQTSPPAIVTEATTTPSPTPANPTTTVRVPILKSSLCGQDPAPHVPALRAYPFTVQDAAATSTDGSTAIPKEPTSEMYQEITTAGNTALPTTLTNVPLPFPEDRTEGTGPTSAAAMLLAESNTQYTPVPVGNEKVATTYSPTSDTVSSQSPVPSTTSVVPTTVRSPTSLNTTHTALPATRGVPTPPSAVESTSVVPEDAPDAASSGTVSFTTTSHRFV
ncbi:uncharacterized protein LOC119383169 [Rhipicephalus sanguineus]|nr:uncharacterized protein LOC119383169 [Rhipicephalus sanguineus]